MLKNIKHILFCLFSVWVVSSCTDDLLYDDSVIGKGEAIISATVDFHPLVTTDNSTSSRGTAGDALAQIEDFTIFIYDADGKLFDIVNDNELTDLSIKQKDSAGGGYNTDMPNDAGGKPVQAEQTTARATFTLKGLPFGRYHIYCVANMGRFEDNEANRKKFLRYSSLQSLQVKWDETNIPANKQMFGYFTTDGNDSNVSAGFEAPLIPVNQTRVQLHAWIKRAASKVTVVYDGSGLHQDIWVFIKGVTIKDIPTHCYIGKENRINDAESMIVTGESIYYDKNGVLPAGQEPSNSSTDWLPVSRGSGKKGAVQVVEGDTILHSEYAQSLYFYENMQGDFKDAANREYYNKKQDWNNVGWVPKPGQYDYKDNVPLGTYIEVEAYYISTNPNQVSQGKIIYRFMLGQDVTYNYNALRNHHYKVTLGFKGYANQPDWHIEYVQEDNTFYNDPTYYVSYKYNTKSIFPVRFIGQVKSFDVEIVENNWAPYDPKQSDSVPPAEVGSGVMDFKWNRPAYLNGGGAPTGATPSEYNDGKYNYGLQSPRTRDGDSDTTYTDALAPKKVTPIWAGFLALNVTGNTEAEIPQEILPQKDKYFYSKPTDLKDFKNYFYDHKQNFRTFTKKDFTFDGWKPGQTMTNVAGEGNNRCEIVKAPDGSISLALPLWTRPKILLGISGFSGNNPYDTYQRKAMVRLTAEFENGNKVVKYMPVYQVRRVVNPKAVWRRWNNNDPFTVKLVRREGPSDVVFKSFDSEGAWRAYVKTWSEGSNGFIELEGGVGKDAQGAIIGNTDTPIEFKIKFMGNGVEKKSHCAIIQVEYHGFTCQHTIFVRQGYFEPLAVNGKARWSSFSLYKCYGVGNDKDTTAFETQWDASKKNYIHCEVTASPLALGTLFKRGNYNGILIENNARPGLGPRQAPGENTTFKMSNGNDLAWKNIKGLPYWDKYQGENDGKAINTGYTWGRFEATVASEIRHYRVPTYDDFDKLLEGEYGIGVLYGSGATETAIAVDDAYGFEDFNNDGNDNIEEGRSTRGMRGIMVFNPSNAHQVFFPLGARGIGRRTIVGFGSSTAYNSFGSLRYGATSDVLTGSSNALRPIPYNLPASPGAIYWIDKAKDSYLGWDMNYFDMNFNAFDYAISFSPGGDALPIKLVLDE